MSDLSQGMSVLCLDEPGFTFVAGPDGAGHYILKNPQGEFVFSTLNCISLPVLFCVDGTPVRRGDTVYCGRDPLVVLAYDVDTTTVTGTKGEAYPAGDLTLTPQLEKKEAFVVLLRDPSAMAGVIALHYPYPTREMAVEAHPGAFLIVKAEWEE